MTEKLELFARFDETGKLVDYWSGDGVPDGHRLEPLPEDFEELPYRWDGEAFVVDWAPLDGELLAKIDAEAGEFRSRYITEIPGQQMTYLDKEAQARAYASGGDIAEAPMIAGEAKARGVAPEDWAAVVVARADEWRALNVGVEVLRVTAKAAVSAATTMEEKRAASVVDWEALLSGEG